MNDRLNGEEEERAGNDVPDSQPPVESPPARPGSSPERPSLQGFDRWIQKRLIPTLGSVIVIAFLFKSFVPTPYGFSIGLVVGVVLLVVIYLITGSRGQVN